ncbi:MAG: GSCFA domain-containing protein [Pricia sp.]
MKLQTKIPIKKAKNQIDYNSRLVLLGSCFVENMGRKLDYFKIRQLQNPFGILFHPLAIEQLVSGAIREERYSESDIFCLNGRWHCFDAHSALSDTSPENLIVNLNLGLEATLNHLKSASHLIVTLGTAWVYQHSETGAVVANCHKIPQRAFSKELLSVAHIADSLKRTVEMVRSVNPNIHFIFTVSPVRHLKDGFVENQRSKAHLISAVHEVLELPETDTSKISHLNDEAERGAQSYFPSYEIMMDELRDYRFYKADMVHPSQLAIDYIWEKFKQKWISEEEYPTIEQIGHIQRGLQHRPFSPDSEQHRKFLESLAAQMAIVQKEYPFIYF